MKRIIKEFSSLDEELAGRLLAAYPSGIRPADLIAFSTGGGRRIYVLEMQTDEALYLVKGPFPDNRSGGFRVLDDEDAIAAASGLDEEE